jgi:hypothetical protein
MPSTESNFFLILKILLNTFITYVDLFGVLNYTHYVDMELESLYNDTAQHAIPVIINSLSNAYARLYNQGDHTDPDPTLEQ